MAWDPTRDRLAMQEQLDSLFGRASTGWVPAADLHEADDRYVLTLEVPGLTRADVNLSFRDHTLTITGERPGGECPQRYQRLERGHGAFARTFSFGPEVDPDRITAEMADGILTVTVPKTTRTSTRRIDVQ